MKTFNQFQEDISKLPGLGGGGGGTNSITDTAPNRSLKKRVGDVSKVLTRPFRKVKKDPTEKFATEGVAALAVKGGSKLIPTLMTGIGAAGTIMQSKKSKGPFADTGGFDASKSRTKRQYLGLPPSSDLSKKEKKNRKLKGQKEIIDRRDDKIAKEGPGDLVPGAKRARLKKLLKDFKDRFQKNLQDKKLINKQIDDRTKAIDDFKKTSKQKRSEKKTRKVENKRSELAIRESGRI